MKIKVKDLNLALEHIKEQQCEFVEVEADDSYVQLGFPSKENYQSDIKIFRGDLNSSPELRTSRKLYKNVIAK